MNKAILIVICDFLVSAMLSMMTGMVAGHSGGTGVGLDENTTRMLLVELENKHRELEELRSQLRRAADSAEVNARLRRLAKEIAANRLQRETLKKQLELTDKNTGELRLLCPDHFQLCGSCAALPREPFRFRQVSPRWRQVRSWRLYISA